MRCAAPTWGSDVTLFLNQLFNGLEAGAVYASIAVALTLIYRTTGLFNFAQGEMAMLSTFVTWQLSEFMGIALAIAIGAAISFVMGAVVERGLIRPMEKKGNPLGTVILTIGLFIGINGLIQLIWPPSRAQSEPFQMPRPFPKSYETIDVAGATLRWFTIWFLVVLAVECLILFLLLQKTKLGLGIRAAASNQDSARLSGIPVGRMLMIGWGLSAVIGAIAGSIIASRESQFDVSTLQFVLAYAFAAAALGGFDSPFGAVIAGFIVGIVDVMAVNYIDAIEGIQIVVPLALTFVVLLVRPQGMFGRRVVERV